MTEIRRSPSGEVLDVSSDDIVNNSTVPGATVTDALDALAGGAASGIPLAFFATGLGAAEYMSPGGGAGGLASPFEAAYGCPAAGTITRGVFSTAGSPVGADTTITVTIDGAGDFEVVIPTGETVGEFTGSEAVALGSQVRAQSVLDQGIVYATLVLFVTPA